MKVGSDVVLQVEGEEEPCVAQVTQIFADKKDNAKFSVFWYYFPDDVKRGRQSYHAVDEIFKSNHNQTDISSKTVIWTCAVLPLSKWVGFAASDANPAVPSKPLRGPVTCENFNMHKDLAACKSICERAAKRRKEDIGVNKGSEKDGTDSADGEDEDGYDSEDDKNRVYLCRHEYMADKEQWKDEEVPVYCLCDLPFNPDIHMVKCNGCGEWYHPRCLNLKDAEVEAIDAGEEWTCPTCLDRDKASNP